MRLDRLRLQMRLQLLTAAALMGLFVVAALDLGSVASQMRQDRIAQTRHQVETVLSLLAHYDAEVRAGHMSQLAAQEAALGAVKSLRYGQNDYFWINDLNAKVLMHPIKPAFDGTDGTLVRDVNGVSPFLRTAEAGRSSEGGTFEYHWPRAGSTVPAAKISYAKTFAP